MNSKVITIFAGLLIGGYGYVFLNESMFVAAGLGYFGFISLSLLNQFGKGIPIRELMCFIVFLQLFLSPLIAYDFFDNAASFEMYVPKEVYFAYILPALYAFSLGLKLPLAKGNNTVKFETIQFSSSIQRIGIWFVFIGIMATVLNDFVPSSLYFIFYLLKLLRFIGVFILYIGEHKFRWLFILIVFTQFSLDTIRGGVFYDLFVWVGFLYMLIENRLKSSFISKVVVIFLGVILIYFIQTIKSDFRAQAFEEDVKESREQIFIDVASSKLEDGNALVKSTNFDKFISRLNTGWIISKVMQHTPLHEPFTNGMTLKEDIKNTLLPRFLFPDKAATGGKQNQMKFTRFTGRRLVGNTTMRIGAFSDAYINFGIIGGWVCMFFLALMFNLFLEFLNKLGRKHPIYFLWIPFIFAYAIRMSDIQVILNYTFKSFLFVVIVNYLFILQNENRNVTQQSN